MFSDLRLAVRAMLRAPAFAISTILTLALGVGANTGAFSALHTLLLKPLPYPEPQRLVSLYETTVDQKPRGVAEANLLDWRARTTAFEAMAAYQSRSFGLTLGDQDPVTVIQTGMVMTEFFRVLKVPPAMGRTFQEKEEFAEAHLIVLTDRLWRTMFSADSGVIGRKVFLNEEPHTVIGVMPPGFEYPMDRLVPDAFIPLSHKDYCCGRLGSQNAIARLQPGSSLPRARTELEAAAAGLAAEYPQTNRGRTAGLQPLEDMMTGNRREPLVLLLSAALLLLAIACANVAGMVLARCLGRSHEMAIRASLGAGVGRIARQFLAEAAVLSLAGGACGLLAAAVVLRAVPEFVPGAGQTEPLRLDGWAFAVALMLALGVTALLAAAPTVWMRSANLSAMIKAGGRQSSRGSRSGLRGALVLTQVALSVVLLLSTGLLLRSFLRLLATSPGFETAHALQFGIGLPGKRYDTGLKEIDFHRELTRKLAALPGVESVGAVLRLPLRGTFGQGAFQLWGANLPVPQWPRSGVNAATPGYFAAMGIPLVEGRDFSWRDDRPQVHRVAIVNQSFARAYLRGRGALGTLLDMRWGSDLDPPGVSWEIVGVAGDTRQANLDREPIPEIFLSISQVGMDGGGYVIRTRGEDAGLARAISKVVQDQDPRIQRIGVKRLDFVVERALGSRSAAIRLVGAFGGLALLLTAVGVYGIVSARASERSREMAIRVALGASRSEIRNLVLGHGLRLAAGGTAAGLSAFLMTRPVWKGQFFGISAADPLTAGAVVAVVLLVALAASLGPSWRASRAAPAELLRDS
jgi:predicted permease